MKKYSVLLFIYVFFTTTVNAAEVFLNDTIIYLDKKKIEVIDSEDKTKVRIYELTEEDGYVEAEKVFEGHYIDGRSYESRKARSINIPIPTWKNFKFRGHWDGFSVGFANFADGSLHVNDINGVSVRGGNSMEYNFNPFSYNMPIKGTKFGVVTGIGMRWNRYKLSGNNFFMEVDGYTRLHQLEGPLAMKTSKLNTTSITVPLLLEWQTGKRAKPSVFISGGVVGVIKTMSSSKIVYYDGSRKIKDKVDGGMNIRPISADFLVQAGIKHLGVYAKYSPCTLFAHGKGPKLHPVSIGVQFYW